MTDAIRGKRAVGTCRLQAVSSRFPTVHDASPEIRLQDRQPE